MAATQLPVPRRLDRSDAVWTGAGLLSALLSVPVLHLAVVDLESKTADQAEYLGQIDARHTPIALAATFGLMLTVGILFYLLGLRRYALSRRPLLADSCTAVGGLAVAGLALGFLCSVLAALAAHEDFPFAVVRTLGAIAENASAVLLPALAGPAVLITVLALADGALPRVFGYASGGFAILLTGLAVLAPGAGSLPALLWLLLSSGSLLLAAVRAGHVDAARAAAPLPI